MASRTLTVTLAGLAMVGAFSVDTFLPSFPAIAADFSVGIAAVQQALSAYLLAFSVMCLFHGTLSDAFGRRPVVLVSLVVFTVASAGAALAPSFGWLLLCRVLQGLSVGAGRVVGQAVVRDRFSGTDAQRLMANITMVFGLAPAVAPVIGGSLHTAFGWRAVFVFLTLLGLGLLAVSWRCVPESLPAARRIEFHPARLIRHYADALRNPRFVAGALAIGFAFGGQAIYIAAAPQFVMTILHLPETAGLGPLRYAVGAVVPYLFYDAGRVTLNKSPWNTLDNHRSLGGGGIGVRYAREAWLAGVTMAWRSHGGASQTDDSSHSPAVLANMAYRF